MAHQTITINNEDELIALKLYEQQIFAKEDKDFRVSRAKSCFNWRDVPIDNFTQKLLSLFNDPITTDVKFIVGAEEKEILCHKSILNIWSPIFSAMWENGWKESSGIVNLPDHTYEAFAAFIKCLYYDVKSCVPQEVELETFFIAHSYQIYEVAEKIGLQLVTNLNHSNAVDYFNAACLTEHKTLESSSCEFIIKWIIKLMDKQTLISEDGLIGLTTDNMAKIVQQLLKVWMKMLKYVKKNENKIEDVQNFVLRWACLKCINEEKELNLENVEKVLGSCLKLLNKDGKYLPKVKETIATFNAEVIAQNSSEPKPSKISKKEIDDVIKLSPDVYFADVSSNLDNLIKELVLCGTGPAISRDYMIWEKFWSAFQKKQERDVEFKVGSDGVHVYCHKMVLLAWSPYFLNLHVTKEFNQPIVIDESVSTLKTLLKFLYTGRFMVREKDALDLLRLSSKWKIVELFSIVSKYIASELLREDTAIDIYNVAEEVKDQHLSRIAFDYIFLKLEIIGEREMLLKKMGSDLVSKLLENDSNIHEEFQLFLFLEKWGKSKLNSEEPNVNCKENLNVFLQSFLHKIRFPTMELDYFMENVVSKGILKEDKIEEIVALIKGKRTKKKTKMIIEPRKTKPVDFRKFRPEQIMAIGIINPELKEKILAQWKKMKRIDLFIKTRWNPNKNSKDYELTEMKKILRDMELNGLKVEKVKCQFDICFFRASFIQETKPIEYFITSEKSGNGHKWPIGFSVLEWNPMLRIPPPIKSHVSTNLLVPNTKPITKFRYSHE